MTSIKIDPYLNIDAGTMSPFEHGEVFVLDDGGEADLDLGNYERFNNLSLTRDHNITTGKVYQQAPPLPSLSPPPPLSAVALAGVLIAFNKVSHRQYRDSRHRHVSTLHTRVSFVSRLLSYQLHRLY